MVSADNVNLDCLELIFAFLAGNDLVSVSLVSKSFLAAVVPRLYRTLAFGLNQAKRYPSIMSPFAAVLAHNNLAHYVRYIDIRAVPIVKSLPQPRFIDECTRTISICRNLGSFTCTTDVMPSFLFSLRQKNTLESIRCIANFTTDQATQAAQIKNLRSLTLDSGSWNAVDILPRWGTALGPSLTSLTLTNISTLNFEIMESTLPSLTLLDSLHVIGCPKVDQDVMMRLFTYVPQIQSLAFTSYESVRRTPPVITPLPRLRHLAIETQWGATPGESTPAFWTTVINLTRMWSCPIKSISLKLSDKIILQDAFVSNLVASYHASLTHLTLRNLALSAEGITRICRDCTELESLKLSVPAKGMDKFTDAVAQAKQLHTITDVGDVHGHHTQRVHIPKSQIRQLMERQPTLEKVIADGRTWTATRSPGKDFELQVKKNGPVLRHWFMPPQNVLEAL